MENYTDLTDPIGKGSYGKVYKVTSKLDGGDYVLKKVAFEGGGAAQSEAEASLREAQVLSTLRHPHIVPYKEFFKHPDGDLCLVMAYCEGGDLFKFIKHLRRAGKHVEETQAWTWLVQLLLALSYCHSKKILHRDVKTQNIFLSEGKLLLGDFGLAKQLQRTLEMARTPIGTPYYMAPEIYEEQPYSFKSDVWALGCVMYEMLTGKPAFAADNLSRVVIRVIKGNYDPLPEHFSPELRNIVSQMLCKAVKKRPDANELLQSPAIMPHVQKYLDSLSQAGPGGWSTWRMKLPAGMLSQMASVLAGSRRTSQLGDEDVDADDGPDTLLPQQFEDMMSSTQLIEGFSLQSLLADAPEPAPAKEAAPQLDAADKAMLAATMSKEQLKEIQDKLQGRNVPGAPEAWGKYAELEVLKKQLNTLSPLPSPGKRGNALPPLAGHNGKYNNAGSPQPPSTPAVNNASLNGRLNSSAKGGAGAKNTGGDVDWLTGNLPKSGFSSFSAGAATPPPANPATAAPRGSQEGGPARPPSSGGRSTSKKESFEFSAPNDLAPPTPTRIPSQSGSSSASVLPAPKRQSSSSQYSDDGLLCDGPVTLGNISLHETLTQRAGRLREYCTKAMGAQAVDQACKIVAEMQASSALPGGHEVDAAIQEKLQGMLKPHQVRELVPLLDELVFLEARKSQRVWAA